MLARNYDIVLYLIALAGLIVAGATRIDQIELFAPDHGSLQNYPTTDWVNWEDVNGEIRATVVLAPYGRASGNELQYIRENDALLSIDYKRVESAEMATSVVQNMPPGSIFIYRVLRENPSVSESKTLNIFVKNDYKPPMLFAEHALYWELYFAWNILLAVTASVLLITLYPFLRTDLRSNLPAVCALLLGLSLAALQIIRHILTLFDQETSYMAFERSASVVFMILYATFALAQLFVVIRSKRAIYLTAPSALFVIAGGLFIARSAWQESALHLYEGLFRVELHAFFLGGLLLFIWRQYRENAQQKARRIFALFFLFIFGLFLYFALALVGLTPQVGVGVFFVSHLLMFAPLALSTKTALAYGKFRAVITQYLFYGAGVLGLILVYLALEEALARLGAGGVMRATVIAGVMLSLFLVLRTIYRRYENRIYKYFMSARQKRLAEAGAFIARIPRYANSEKLIEDFENVLADDLNVGDFIVWFNTSNYPEQLLDLSGEESAALFQALESGNGYWSDREELGAVNLPTGLAENMKKTGIALAFPLKISSETYGLLLIGRKNRGVFNLTEIELIYRMVQQLRLTLEILNLLEQEKLLVEKTMEANLIALRSQINPHFLFNTFNSISHLIDISPGKAQEALEKLAYIFRYTLKVSRENYVPLQDEMKLVRTYLDIEEIRFGDRLDVYIETDEACLPIEIPAFVVQTVVENCIKHGITKIMEPGVVHIKVFKTYSKLIVEVYDNGPGIDLKRVQKGTGLKNIIQRLQSFYNRGDIITFENTGDGTLVTLRIPLLTVADG